MFLDVKGHKLREEYIKTKKALCIIQRNVKSWFAKWKFKKRRKACVVIQKNVRCWLCQIHFKRIVKSVVILQKYTRGWIARKTYEILLDESRLKSMTSMTSLTSLGYFSLTASSSSHGINANRFDRSPSDTHHSNSEMFGMNEEMLRYYLNPENRSRLTEMEESGIETDTESLSGEASKMGFERRSKVKRRRAKLHRLLRNRFGRDLDDTDENSAEDLSENSPEFIEKLDENFQSHNSVDGAFTLKRKNSSEGGSSEISNVSGSLQNETDSMRVATLLEISEITSVLTETSPNENLQMVLPSHNLSLFFKSGVLSYRRMPTVSVYRYNFS